MRGRKPKPTKFRELVGNPSGRPLNTAEPEYPAGAGDCPVELDDAGRAEWERVSRLMTASGVLTAADRAVLTLYCSAWSRWAKANAFVLKTGEVLKTTEGNFYQNPYLSVANKALEQVAKLAAALGLDPTSRTRVHAATPGTARAQIATRPRTKLDAAPPPKKK